MKKTLSIILILALAISCTKHKTNTQTTITAQFTDLSNDTVYLYGFGMGYDRLDTIVLDNGGFSIGIDSDTTSVALLRLSDSIEFPIFIEKDTSIKISGKAKSKYDLRAIGGKYNKEYATILDSLKRKIIVSDSVYQEMMENFVIEHPSSLVDVYVIYRMFYTKKEPDFHKIRQLFENIEGHLKDWEYMSRVRETIYKGQYAEVDKFMPYFNLKGTDGKYYSRNSDDFRGKALVVSIWSSWDDSINIKNYFRDIAKLQEKYKNNKYISFLGISLDVDREEWIKAISKYKIKGVQVMSEDSYWGEIATSLGINITPYNLLIDRNGRIINTDMAEQELIKQCDRLIEGEIIRERNNRQNYM